MHIHSRKLATNFFHLGTNFWRLSRQPSVNFTFFARDHLAKIDFFRESLTRFIILQQFFYVIAFFLWFFDESRDSLIEFAFLQLFPQSFNKINVFFLAIVWGTVFFLRDLLTNGSFRNSLKKIFIFRLILWRSWRFFCKRYYFYAFFTMGWLDYLGLVKIFGNIHLYP